MVKNKLKPVYAVSLYQVGSPNGKSHALILPAPIVKAFNFTSQTLFTLRVDSRGTIQLEPITSQEKERPDGIAVPSVESAAPQIATTGVDENE